jgi:hypothetical protein
MSSAGTGQHLPDDRATQYRRLASDCLRLLQTFSTEEARAALTEMARVWTRLADQQYAGSLRMPPPDPPQPVAQQQQQVQPKKDEKE